MKPRAVLLFAILLWSGTACDKSEATYELAPDCGETQTTRVFGKVAVSNAEAARLPLGVEGPRLIGCLHNQGDEALDRASFAYSFDGGGGQAELQFAELEPGETAPFVSETITWSPDADDAESGANIEFAALLCARECSSRRKRARSASRTTARIAAISSSVAARS